MKGQVGNVVTKMLQEEREEFRKKMKKIDELNEEEHSPLIFYAKFGMKKVTIKA